MALSGLGKPKSERSQQTQESAQMYANDNSYTDNCWFDDGWSCDEWNEDWSWHECWKNLMTIPQAHCLWEVLISVQRPVRNGVNGCRWTWTQELHWTHVRLNCGPDGVGDGRCVSNGQWWMHSCRWSSAVWRLRRKWPKSIFDRKTHRRTQKFCAIQVRFACKRHQDFYCGDQTVVPWSRAQQIFVNKWPDIAKVWLVGMEDKLSSPDHIEDNNFYLTREVKSTENNAANNSQKSGNNNVRAIRS